MRIGVTGHQKRDGISWKWVAKAIGHQVELLLPVKEAFSSLAIGSDQVFAEVLLELGIPLTSVIPLKEYRSYFTGEGLVRYDELLERSAPIHTDAA